MEDIYDDLENFNDVNVVNELRAENEELKQKLGQYAESMATLQKDFDNLSAELKKLETNYSSLLKSARLEIKKKTDMIKNLNTEKDMLVLKQFQNKPEHRQKLMNAYKVKAEENVRKKNNPNAAEALKQRDEFRKSPSENSSTATEKSVKSLSTENRIGDCAKSTATPNARSMSKENETHQNNEEFPNNRATYHDNRLQAAAVTDRRISLITSQQFLKFSSDEEFEDMYSALEPKTTSKGTSFADEPQKGQKRVRDEPQYARAYNEGGPQDKRLNYNDAPRDRFNKNRNRRFNENDRNLNRDKYDLPHPNRNKYSPDRARFGKRDFGDERCALQYARPRRPEHAVADWHQTKPRRERRPYPERSRSDQNVDMGRHNYPDATFTGKTRLASSTQIHGEYDPPPMKRFRGDRYPRTDEERRRDDRQFLHDYHPSEMKETDQHTQIDDELVYADLDKPVCDTAMPDGDGNIIKSNHDMGSERDVSFKNDRRSKKNDNVTENLRSKHTEEKFNDGENMHKVTKYKIPLKGHQVNDDEHLGMPKTKRNNVDKSIHSGESGRSSLSHSDLPPVNDCIKHSELVKTVGTLKLNNTEPTIPPLKISKIGKNECVVSTLFERALEQKLSSIRNIVEGDLELSDETNDDTQVQHKDNEPQDTKKKHKTKKKSRGDSSKDKITTRKTRSKTDKDKDIKSKNKFSELFGDSSSLITPEDLELAPEPAPAQLADALAAASDDAQDGLAHARRDTHSGVRTVAAKKEILEPNSNLILPQTDCFHLEEKSITKETKDSKIRAHHRKHKKSELTSNDDVKDLKEKELSFSNIVNSPTTESVKTTSLSDVEKNSSIETPKEQRVLNEPETKIKGDVPETILMPEVKTVASSKNCNDTPKETKQHKKTRSDSVTMLSMPEVNTAVTSDKGKDKRQVNKPSIVETHLMPKVKESSNRSKEISHSLKPNKKTEIDVLKAHLAPEVKSVASVDKSKDISNSAKPDTKTKLDIAETHFIPDVKTIATSEKSDEVFNVIKSDCQKDPIIEIPSVEAKPAVTREKPYEEHNVTKTDKNKCGDKNKDHTKSSKKPKCNEDKILPSSGNSKESYVNKNHSTAEVNKPSIKNSNKENESSVKVPEETTNKDLPKFFEDTLVPIENKSVDKNITNKEKLTVTMMPKETISDTTLDDTPNLEAVTEDSGLVNTVVISSGIQPSDVNVLPVNAAENYKTLKALATSTPSRQLPTLNTPSEMKPLTSPVKTNTANEIPVSNNDESDMPDVRIYCYRRRRKLVK